MAKIMDPILPILSILGYWAIILGSFGSPGTLKIAVVSYTSRISQNDSGGYVGPLSQLQAQGLTPTFVVHT